MIGAELGYRYVGSPIIWEEPGGPEHLFREYVPTTWPGARLPHVWASERTPFQDLIGDGYTLLRLGRTTADTTPLEQAMRAHPCALRDADAWTPQPRVTSTGTIFFCCGPTFMSPGGATRIPKEPARLAALVTGH